MFPVNVHQFGKLAQLAGKERITALISQLLGEMKILQHVALIGAGPRILIPKNLRGCARCSRKEQQQPILQIGQCLRR